MPDEFVADKPCAELNLKLESEARSLSCMYARIADPRIPAPVVWNRTINKDGTEARAKCIASACAHWRWRQASGTRYELRSFQSEFPIPTVSATSWKPPADVEEGWEFAHWDANAKPSTPLPRYWARRGVEVVLAKGCCGLAGDV
jgi:hypothetical protein